MKKTLAFILLLYHVNFSMFLPQLQETDSFDVDGKPQDDINSLFEFVDQVVLNHKDATPEDEDDDNPHFYTVVQTISFYSDQHFLEIPVIVPDSDNKNTDSFQSEPKLTSISMDIISPPPES